jgi:hypothetical protein
MMERAVTAMLLVLGVVAICVVLASRLDNDAPLSFGTAAAGIITFFHFVAVGRRTRQGEPASGEGSFRRAIAGAIIVEYIVLVGIVAYFKRPQEALPAITQALVTNLTTVVGIVIAFYFGSSAYVEASRARGARKADGSGKERPAASEPPETS